jgi:starch synthase
VKILLATSEAVPFAKTGGLADVCGALPAEVSRLGHEPTIIMPAYPQIYQAGVPIERTGVQFEIPIGSKMVAGSFLRSRLPGTAVDVVFVEQEHYYNRRELYTVDGKDYRDNCERFIFFCRAVLESIRLLDIKPDVIHANDWQTGLLPAYLKIEYRGVPDYENISTLFTIHNMAYQGIFWHWDMLLTGLDWKYFNWHQMEFFGNLNLLKTGLVFADRINTVSPRYAEEIQTPPHGCGLEGVLQSRRALLSGIINGVDYEEWNPASDRNLIQPYGSSEVRAGKAACKAALQAELGLPALKDVPLVAFIGRLVEQKGIDLVASVLKDWLPSQDVQWIILGTGDPGYQDLFSDLSRRNPQKFAFRMEFSNPLAHRIEAGADIFLMPSRFEPCGLNQLYSLKYGTVPVVRATGGLDDTIVNLTDATIVGGTANGFCFREYSALALSETLKRVRDIFTNQRDVWDQLVKAGMGQNWSWTNSARQYVELYQRTIAQSRPAIAQQSS